MKRFLKSGVITMGRSSSGFRPSGRMRRKIYQMPYQSLRPYRRTKAHMSLSLAGADFRARKTVELEQLNDQQA